MKKIIIGNWKENPDNLEIARELLDISRKGVAKKDLQIMHAVPSIFASALKEESGTTLILQDISEFENGSHTGEISVKQMLNSGIRSSIIGHSETRLSPKNPKGDEDVQVNTKVKNLISNKCGFVLCIGEYKRENVDYKKLIQSQIEQSLKGIGPEIISKNIIAYEPVWAIGKDAKRVATNAEIIEMVSFIKAYLKEKLGIEMCVLYGGSVDENNAKEILGLDGVDGLLIGRASSDPEKWKKLLENVILTEASDSYNKNITHPGKYKQISNLNIKKGDKVILRLDLNVPIDENGKVLNDYRIQESLPTVKILQNLGARTTIIAHKEKGDFQSLAEYLEDKLDNFYYLKHELQDGEVLLLDNIRLNEAEKKNDGRFAEELSSLGDFYINEAFSASHREHASIVGIPKFLGKDRCALGPKFIQEIYELTKALKPVQPMLLIVGGAKFDTKLAMLNRFMNIAENIFVGGALAHNFWKQKYRYDLGLSLLDEEVQLDENILTKTGNKILLPMDIMVESRETKTPDKVNPNEKIVDFGEKTLEKILVLAKNANTIVWNGPLGYYEGGFDWGTRQLLMRLSEIKKHSPDKVVILGGGDTVAEIDKVNQSLEKYKGRKLEFTHVSTGGGAMIDFLSKGTLPGIDAVCLQH